MDERPLLEMAGITKSFPGVKALSDVDFTLRAGEIHALMGENGAGKSTLIKVLTGVYARDGGRVLLEGRPIDPRSPLQARALGIATVYQEVNLIGGLSVAENIYLGRQPSRWGFIRWGAIRRRAAEAMRRLDIDVDVTAPLGSCSIAIQQMVAIARAVDVDAKLLILDEPTSSLDRREVGQLFGVMRRLKAGGIGILFVTHFLDRMYEISDRVTVLRNGELVGVSETAHLPRIELISQMIGRTPEQVEPDATGGQPQAAKGEAFLEARRLGRAGSVADVDLALRGGEVVALAGLLGSGRTETARLLFGIDRPDAGEILIGGRAVGRHSPRAAVRLGLAFTPEDRRDAGVVPDLSVRENIVLALQASRGAWRALSRARQLTIAERFIRALDIKTPSPEQAVGNLSGGNQQKVLLARWLATEPKLLILDEPTRGIDVGAKAEIERLIASLRARGMAILFISSELEEVVRDSQRVVVLRDRRKVGELVGGQISESAIMKAIAGR